MVSQIGGALLMLAWVALLSYRVIVDPLFRQEWGVPEHVTISPLVLSVTIVLAVFLFLAVGVHYHSPPHQRKDKELFSHEPS